MPSPCIAHSVGTRPHVSHCESIMSGVVGPVTRGPDFTAAHRVNTPPSALGFPHQSPQAGSATQPLSQPTSRPLVLPLHDRGWLTRHLLHKITTPVYSSLAPAAVRVLPHQHVALWRIWLTQWTALDSEPSFRRSAVFCTQTSLASFTSALPTCNFAPCFAASAQQTAHAVPGGYASHVCPTPTGNPPPMYRNGRAPNPSHQPCTLQPAFSQAGPLRTCGEEAWAHGVGRCGPVRAVVKGVAARVCQHHAALAPWLVDAHKVQVTALGTCRMCKGEGRACVAVGPRARPDLSRHKAAVRSAKRYPPARPGAVLTRLHRSQTWSTHRRPTRTTTRAAGRAGLYSRAAGEYATARRWAVGL